MHRLSSGMMLVRARCELLNESLPVRQVVLVEAIPPFLGECAKPEPARLVSDRAVAVDRQRTTVPGPSGKQRLDVRGVRECDEREAFASRRGSREVLVVRRQGDVLDAGRRGQVVFQERFRKPDDASDGVIRRRNLFLMYWEPVNYGLIEAGVRPLPSTPSFPPSKLSCASWAKSLRDLPNFFFGFRTLRHPERCSDPKLTPGAR
jgi:hypothetical protein